MVFCPEHPKRDQNLKFTPLSETTNIPPLSYGSSPRGDCLTEVSSAAEVSARLHCWFDLKLGGKDRTKDNLILVAIWLYSSTDSILRGLRSWVLVFVTPKINPGNTDNGHFSVSWVTNSHISSTSLGHSGYLHTVYDWISYQWKPLTAETANDLSNGSA